MGEWVGGRQAVRQEVKQVNRQAGSHACMYCHSLTYSYTF